MNSMTCIMICFQVFLMIDLAAVYVCMYVCMYVLCMYYNYFFYIKKYNIIIMEKLLDTGGSCDKLRKKGILTEDEYKKCTDISDNISESSFDSMQDEDNKKYLEKVYDTPSDKIHEQNLL